MFSWPLGAASCRFVLDFFLNNMARFLDDLDFFGFCCSAPPSPDDKLPESEDLSLTKDLSDMLLFVFLCIVGPGDSSLTGILRAWGGLLMCRSPSGASEWCLVVGLLPRTLDASFSLFFLPRRKSPTEVVCL